MILKPIRPLAPSDIAIFTLEKDFYALHHAPEYNVTEGASIAANNTMTGSLFNLTLSNQSNHSQEFQFVRDTWNRYETGYNYTFNVSLALDNGTYLTPNFTTGTYGNHTQRLTTYYNRLNSSDHEVTADYSIDAETGAVKLAINGTQSYYQDYNISTLIETPLFQANYSGDFWGDDMTSFWSLNGTVQSAASANSTGDAFYVYTSHPTNVTVGSDIFTASMELFSNQTNSYDAVTYYI